MYLKKVYRVYFKVNIKSSGWKNQNVLVYAKDKKSAEKRFRKFMKEREFSSDINEIRFSHVGEMYITISPKSVV